MGFKYHVNQIHLYSNGTVRDPRNSFGWIARHREPIWTHINYRNTKTYCSCKLLELLQQKTAAYECKPTKLVKHQWHLLCYFCILFHILFCLILYALNHDGTMEKYFLNVEPSMVVNHCQFYSSAISSRIILFYFLGSPAMFNRIFSGRPAEPSLLNVIFNESSHRTRLRGTSPAKTCTTTWDNSVELGDLQQSHLLNLLQPKSVGVRGSGTIWEMFTSENPVLHHCKWSSSLGIWGPLSN